MPHRILIVEDEKDISELIELNLQLENYTTRACAEAKEALQLLAEERFDLIILDVMLPVMSGIALCESIRLEDTKTPILFLSAKGQAKDKIEGLKKGGDDYMAKPFELEELLLRIQKLLHRNQAETNVDEFSIFTFGNNKIDFESHKAIGNQGQTIILTKYEAKFLKLLIENQGQFVSRKNILHAVWGYNIYPSSRSIDNFIVGFRKNFEIDPKNPKHFISLRSVGYKFEKGR
jgi:two-component system alkaline phosphatase synthesis response regulator PhoP